jgi:hypothetical protein
MHGIGTSVEPNEAVRWSTAPCAVRLAACSPLGHVRSRAHHQTAQLLCLSPQFPSPRLRSEAKISGKHFARTMNRAAFLPIVTVTSKVHYPSPSDKRED